MYLRVDGSSAERWRRAGKYEAKRDQMRSERRKLERWESSPEYPAREKRTYMR